MVELILEALRAMRPPFALYEADLHSLVEQALEARNLPYVHEAKIGAGCRIDFRVGAIGLEIKKGKPNRTALLAQLRRYAACDALEGIVVVSWQRVALPGSVAGKPVYGLSLSALWGVSLP